MSQIWSKSCRDLSVQLFYLSYPGFLALLYRAQQHHLFLLVSFHARWDHTHVWVDRRYPDGARMSKHRTVWITVSEHSIVKLSSWVQQCCGLSGMSWQVHVFFNTGSQLVVLWERWSLADRATRGGPYLYFSLLSCEGHPQACNMAGSRAVPPSPPLRTKTPWIQSFKSLYQVFSHNEKIARNCLALRNLWTPSLALCACVEKKLQKSNTAPRVSGGQELCLYYCPTTPN